jgi:hypothetical protein
LLAIGVWGDTAQPITGCLLILTTYACNVGPRSTVEQLFQVTPPRLALLQGSAAAGSPV